MKKTRLGPRLNSIGKDKKTQEQRDPGNTGRNLFTAFSSKNGPEERGGQKKRKNVLFLTDPSGKGTKPTKRVGPGGQPSAYRSRRGKGGAPARHWQTGFRNTQTTGKSTEKKMRGGGTQFCRGNQTINSIGKKRGPHG